MFAKFLKKRFTVSLLFSLTIHIGLFLCFSFSSQKNVFSSPKITYYQQKIVPKTITKIEQKRQEKENSIKKASFKREKNFRAEKKNINLDKIEIKKKGIETKKSFKHAEQKPRAKKRKLINRKQKEGRIKGKVLTDYYRFISEQIKEKAVYPEKAQTNWSEGLVYISFTIFNNGYLKETVVRISSGDNYLDKAALRSVQEAAPFPAFPPQIKKKQLSLNIPVSFEIE